MKKLKKILGILAIVLLTPILLISQEIRTESNVLTIAQNYIEKNEQTFPSWKDSTIKNVNPIYSSNNIIVAYEVSLENASGDDNGYIIIDTDLNKLKIATFSENGKSIVDSLTNYYETKLQETFEEKGLTPIEYRILGSLPSHFAIGVKFNEEPIEDKKFISEDGWYIFAQSIESQMQIYHRNINTFMKPYSQNNNENHISTIKSYQFSNFYQVDKNGKAVRLKGMKKGYIGCTPIAWVTLLEYYDRYGYGKLIASNKDNSNRSMNDPDIRSTLVKLREYLNVKTDNTAGSINYYEVEKIKSHIKKRGYYSRIKYTGYSVKNPIINNNVIDTIWKKIKKEVDNNRPCIVHYRVYTKKLFLGFQIGKIEEAHSAVVYGYDSNTNKFLVKTGHIHPEIDRVDKKELFGIHTIKLLNKVATPTTTPIHQYIPPKYYIANIQRTDKHTNIVRPNDLIKISFIEGYYNDKGKTKPITKFYFSKNTTLDSRDTFIASFSTNLSEFGNNKKVYQKNISIRIPRYAKNGTHYLLIKTNNSKVKYLKLVVKKPLVPAIYSIQNERITSGSNKIKAGDSLIISFTQTRINDKENKNIVTGILLSKNAYLDSSDIRIERRKDSVYSTPKDLKNGKHHQSNIRVTIPKGTKTGRYYLILNPNNNGSKSQRGRVGKILINIVSPIQTKKDDVYPSNLRLSSNSVKKGEKVKLKVKVNYKGGTKRRELGLIYTSYYTIDSFGRKRYLGRDTSTIGTDDRYDYEYFNIDTSKLSKGTYTILVIVDDKNGRSLLKETNERNNEQRTKLVIKDSGGSSNVSNGKDDIYPSKLRLSSGSKKRGIKVRVRVNHRGDSTKRQIGTIYTSYYISRSSTFNRRNATYVGKDSSSIGTDDRYDDESIYVKTNRLSRGTYYIHVVVDDKNGRSSLKETNENNNVMSTKLLRVR